MKPTVVFLVGLFTTASTATLNEIECPVGCSMDFDQVCGSDGETYSNPCMLGIAACMNPNLNITVDHEGECSDDPDPDPTPTPSATTLVPTTTPPPTPPHNCSMICSRVFVPVCGSNGKTYASYCRLLRDMCRYPNVKPPLVQRHAGVCKDKVWYP